MYTDDYITYAKLRMQILLISIQHRQWQGTDSRHYGTCAQQRIVNTQ